MDKFLDKKGLALYSKKTKEYIKDFVEERVPEPPTTDGTYTLQVTVNNGSVSYAWVSVSQGN